MSAATVRKAARYLEVGDVSISNAGNRLVVLHACWNGECVEVTWGRLGTQDGANPIVNHIPDTQFTVELPAGLTPVQAAADRLLKAVRVADTLLRDAGGAVFNASLRALLDELDPPKPPTLEEAIALMRGMQSRTWASDSDAIAKFLARVQN